MRTSCSLRGIGWHVAPEEMYAIGHYELIVCGDFVKATNYSQVSDDVVQSRYERRYKVESMVIGWL